MAKGNFIEYVVSDNPNKYPNGGEQSGYYYELYGAPKTLISFTIAGTSYQAEEGMTWEEWVESEYNTDGLTLLNNHVGIKAGMVAYPSNELVLSTDTINKDGTYTTICCVVAGTQVQVSLDGRTVPIETLSIGDPVVSYNSSNKELYLAKVRQLYINKYSYGMAKITFENGSELKITSYHPVLTVDGFHSITRYQGLPELKVGDIVITVDGETIVKEIYCYILDQPITTYSIDVQDYNEIIDDDTNDTFIANGIVVHNAGCV